MENKAAVKMKELAHTHPTQKLWVEKTLQNITTVK